MTSALHSVHMPTIHAHDYGYDVIREELNKASTLSV